MKQTMTPMRKISRRTLTSNSGGESQRTLLALSFFLLEVDMTNVDVASLIIFVLGLIGVVIEPWSPQPHLMRRFGIAYFCVRITAPIIVTKVMSLRNLRKEKRSEFKDNSDDLRYHRSNLLGVDGSYRRLHRRE